MRIIVHGQQAFGEAVLKALIERGEDIVAVYCSPDKEGRPVDSIKTLALEHDLPVYQPKTFKDPDVWEECKALKPDLGVMAYVTKFVPEEFLYIPTKGTIQYHPSLLPLHRGPSSINWPIIMGSKKTGLSIFWPDNGLDEGPILLQKETEISDTDTLGSVYFDRLFPMGVEAMVESVDLVRNGKAPKIDQDESKSTYESWCRKDDVQVDWSKPADEVSALIRGANPQPGAWTTHDGKVLQVFDCVKSSATGAAGEVIAIDDNGVTVAAGDGSIVLQRVRPEGDKKLKAADFIASSGISVGTKFG
ncbi:MAG: methionyl-tRNA formyltransferase [Alphaproteobacteria bacterium]|nr:methionyl-tRNA formyltransferase [Alphaproteobacteria bacterium]